MLQNLSSASVVIGALRVNSLHAGKFFMISASRRFSRDIMPYLLFLIKQQNLRLWSAKFVVCFSPDWRFKG